MYGREFLWIAQTTKCRVVEDNEVLYVHSLETLSLCWHSTNVLSRQHIHMWVLSHPLCKETINQPVSGSWVLTSDLQENNASTITTTDGSLNSRLGRLPYLSVEYRLFEFPSRQRTCNCVAFLYSATWHPDWGYWLYKQSNKVAKHYSR